MAIASVSVCTCMCWCVLVIVLYEWHGRAAEGVRQECEVKTTKMSSDMDDEYRYPSEEEYSEKGNEEILEVS